jgi:hypothetical protein
LQRLWSDALKRFICQRCRWNRLTQAGIFLQPAVGVIINPAHKIAIWRDVLDTASGKITFWGTLVSLLYAMLHSPEGRSFGFTQKVKLYTSGFSGTRIERHFEWNTNASISLHYSRSRTPVILWQHRCDHLASR